MTSRRLLLCGHDFHPVMLDLAEGLERRHWRVDLMPAPFERPADGGPLARGLAGMLPPRSGMARAVRRAGADIHNAAEASRWFEHLERTLARRAHDAVLAHLDLIPPGLGRVVTRCHPAAALISMVALPHELRFRRVLPLLRLAASAVTAAPLHRDLFRPLDAARPTLVVCPSGAWLDELVAAGVPRSHGCVIPFGVHLPPPQMPRARASNDPPRLLWAGRLAPEKGLHLFLAALPLVAAHRPARLTVIAMPGDERYARRIATTLEATPGLAALVDMRGPVSRADLRIEYERHDVLLFHSVFREPVAQVMLAAAAVGLPVVGPASPVGRSLLREGETAWCFSDPSPATVAATILRALDDPQARAERAARLEREVRRDHDITQTIAAYDRLLQDRVAAARESERIHA